MIISPCDFVPPIDHCSFFLSACLCSTLKFVGLMTPLSWCFFRPGIHRIFNPEPNPLLFFPGAICSKIEWNKIVIKYKVTIEQFTHEFVGGEHYTEIDQLIDAQTTNNIERRSSLNRCMFQLISFAMKNVRQLGVRQIRLNSPNIAFNNTIFKFYIHDSTRTSQAGQ